MESKNIWYCDNLDLYRILCPPKLKRYGRNHLTNFGQGDIIYLEKDQAQQLYLVENGKVKIVSYDKDGNEIIKAILTKGRLFGEMVFFGEEQRQDFAISIAKKTAVCPINLDKMHDLMRANKLLSTYIYKMIGLRIRKVEKRLEMILFKDAATRLKELINELATEFGKKNNCQIIIQHPYTQHDIAALIGLRRETVNNLLQQFKEDKQITYRRYQITISCPQWLAELPVREATTATSAILI